MNASRISLTVAALAAAALLAACGSTGRVTTTTTPQESTSSETTAPAETETETAPPAAETRTAVVGDPLVLNGMTDGSQVTVTVVKVVTTAKADEYMAPEPGNRFAAVKFQIVNTGTVAYNDSPSNGAVVIDADAQQFTSSVWAAKGLVELPATVKLAPGGKAVGYVTFEVSKASVLTGVQFGMDSGYADTGEWKIPAAA
jgi:hypothetical protein